MKGTEPAGLILRISGDFCSPEKISTVISSNFTLPAKRRDFTALEG